jgi:methionine-rich copper-binding protein CopC
MKAHSSMMPVAALIATAGLILGVSEAQAHPQLVSATPAANETVAAPKTITLHFSEKLEAKFSGLELTKDDGGKVEVVSSVPVGDRKAVTGVVTGQLAPGTYMVMWHAVSADGHRIKGNFNFIVP